MMSQPYERAAIVGTIDPQNGNNTTQNTDYVDMSKFAEALFIFQLGAVDNTVDCLVRESTNTSDGGGQTLSGKSATQLTSNDDTKQVVINVKAELERRSGSCMHARLCRGARVFNGAGLPLPALGMLVLPLYGRVGAK